MSATPVLLDSFTNSFSLNNINSSSVMLGQSFDSSVGGLIGNAWFYLRKSGSPTGVLNAYLYAHSGVYGTSSVPTGSFIGISDPYTISDLPTTQTWIYLHFSSDYVMDPNTKYCIILGGSGGTLDGSNFVRVASNNASPTHAGNVISSSDGGSNWTPDSANDILFKIYNKYSGAPGNIGRRLIVGDGMSLGEQTP